MRPGGACRFAHLRGRLVVGGLPGYEERIVTKKGLGWRANWHKLRVQETLSYRGEEIMNKRNATKRADT
jgi:hypothetical protein